MGTIRSRDDRGATAIFVGVTLIGLLAIAGLVIDGSNAYSQRRQMQNAADTASLAGTNTLQQVRTAGSGVTPDQILIDARDAAADNGSKVDSSFTCRLVRLDSAGNEVGTVACPTSPHDTVPSDAYGVRVETASDHGTSFIQVVGADGFTARGTATAMLRRAAVGAAPFMVCANAPGHPVPLLNIPDPLHPEDATVNTAAIGENYVIWGNDIKDGGRDCGNTSSSFRGLVDNDHPDAPFSIPGWWEADQGNKGGQVIPTIAGGCGIDTSSKKEIEETAIGCEFGLPLCTHGNNKSGNNFDAYCVAVGRFKVTSVGSNHMEADFIGGGVATSGAGTGVPVDGDLVVIKLSE